MKREIAISNWHSKEPYVFKDELSWSKDEYLDAETTDPEAVFNYYWRHYRSIVFYYLGDNNFYELFMEGHPFKFWRIQTQKDWDGKWVCDKINWNNHEEGDVLFTFDDNSDLWNELKLNGKTIGEVLENSVIAEINI